MGKGLPEAREDEFQYTRPPFAPFIVIYWSKQVTWLTPKSRSGEIDPILDGRNSKVTEQRDMLTGRYEYMGAHFCNNLQRPKKFLTFCVHKDHQRC